MKNKRDGTRLFRPHTISTKKCYITYLHATLTIATTSNITINVKIIIVTTSFQNSIILKYNTFLPIIL